MIHLPCLTPLEGALIALALLTFGLMEASRLLRHTTVARTRTTQPDGTTSSHLTIMRRPVARLTGDLATAAAREFEGAKPGLIAAFDAAVDALPDDLDLTAIESRALPALAALAERLLAANPLLGGAAPLLTGLLPFAFARLPKTVDVAGYKAGLKDELHELITEAKL